MRVAGIGTMMVHVAGIVKAQPSNMNSIPYKIANPPGTTSPRRNYRGDYFEIYGPTQHDQYSEVSWHAQTTDLPPEIVKHFDNKVMAVTGMEVDIIRKSADGTDESVSCYEHYNHHYTSYMHGKNVRKQLNSAVKLMGPHGCTLPHWVSTDAIDGTCDFAGVWFNPTNGISVNVTQTPGKSTYDAACMGGKGWAHASGTITPPDTTSPQGGATLHCGAPTKCDSTGIFSSIANSPPCTLIQWHPDVSNVWCKQPYCSKYVNPTPAPAPASQGFPQIQVFSEGNGNEHRASYKGAPAGFAQLIESPVTFISNPMIINTNKRLTSDMSPGPIGGPQPRNSLAPPNADYQGILECPCTTRLPKVLEGYLSQPDGGKCTGNPAEMTVEECAHAVATLQLSLANNASVSVVDDATLPSGCFATAHANISGYSLTVNTHVASPAPCGGPPGAAAHSGVSGTVGAFPSSSSSSATDGATTTNLVTAALALDPTTATATLTLTISTEAADGWVGVAFGAKSMADSPYAIIVDAAGNSSSNGGVQERKLANHDAGAPLAASVTLTSDAMAGGTRTIVLKRPLAGATKDHYSFTADRNANLPILMAIGSTATFSSTSIHKDKEAVVLALAPLDSPVCVCRDPASNKGTIGGKGFNPGVCAPFPTSQLLTGSPYGQNGICNISTYGGGLLCCGGGVFLLDADQEIPETKDTWQLKYRFYFEDYTNQTNIYRVWWSTEATNNEYDVPKSTFNCLDPSTPVENCTHKIESKFKGRDMLQRGSGCMISGDPNACIDDKKIASDYGGKFRLMYAAAHCHAPACMSIELWNDDTGDLICRNIPEYGNSTEVQNEAAYIIGIPPCLWGDAADGLAPPPILDLDSNLTTIKRANNTNGHWGVMALWQMRAAYLH